MRFVFGTLKIIGLLFVGLIVIGMLLPDPGGEGQSTSASGLKLKQTGESQFASSRRVYDRGDLTLEGNPCRAQKLAAISKHGLPQTRKSAVDISGGNAITATIWRYSNGREVTFGATSSACLKAEGA